MAGVKYEEAGAMVYPITKEVNGSPRPSMVSLPLLPAPRPAVSEDEVLQEITVLSTTILDRVRALVTAYTDAED